MKTITYKGRNYKATMTTWISKDGVQWDNASIKIGRNFIGLKSVNGEWVRENDSPFEKWASI